MSEANNDVMNWIKSHPGDPLVVALRALSGSNNTAHGEAFLRLVEIIAERAGMPEFCTSAEERATEAAIHDWFGSCEMIAGEDAWIMLLCTIRYSMGRMTYMTSLCTDLYLRYRKHLEPCQRAQIWEEVETEVRRAESRGGLLGHACDHQAWRQLLDIIARETPQVNVIVRDADDGAKLELKRPEDQGGSDAQATQAE